LSVFSQAKFDISLKTNTPAEAKTKAQLERLIKSYDLEKWIFTRKIEIDEKAMAEIGLSLSSLLSCYPCNFFSLRFAGN
jgi:hypothetical protein